MAVEHLEWITTKFEFSAANVDPLVQTCMTTLSSKIVNSCKRSLAEIAVNSVVAVADLERRDVNLELIKVEGKLGGKLEDTELIKGIIVDKDMSHQQMPKHFEDAKIAILTCPFEPPKPKTKHKVDIDTVEKFQNLHEQEQKYFFMTWFRNAREVCTLKMWEDCSKVPRVDPRKARQGNKMLIEETKQSIHDALCVAWNLIRNNSIVYGGGAAEISCSLAVEAAADRHPGIEQDAIRAFADVLDAIPMALAEDSGLQLQPIETLSAVKSQQIKVYFGHDCFLIETLSAVKSQQIKENNPYCGIDCNDVGTNDMREQTIFEILIGKQQQKLLATQVVKMILKIDNVLSPSEY